MAEQTLVPAEGDTLALGRFAKPVKEVVMTGSVMDTEGKGATPAEIQATKELAVAHAGTEGNAHALTLEPKDTTIAVEATATGFKAKATEVLTNGAISFTSDNGSNVLLTGAKASVLVPYNCEINSWEITADLAGSIELDVWKTDFANYPASIADTIVGGNYPVLISEEKATGLVTDWTAVVEAGSYLQLNIRSVSLIRKVTLTLKVTKK